MSELPTKSKLETGIQFWWVNQNQTYQQKFGGGYLWPPKTNINADGNAPFYSNMTKVDVGDVVFSFKYTLFLLSELLLPNAAHTLNQKNLVQPA